MMKSAFSAVPLLAVAGAGLFGALSACGERAKDDGFTEDALYEGTDYETPDASPICTAQRSQPFAPNLKPSQPLHQGVCTAAQIDEVVRCRATPLRVRQQSWTEPEVTACKLFDRNLANRACRSCAVTFDGSTARRGALLDVAGTAVPNLVGCLEKLEDVPFPLSCAAKIQGAEQCAASSRAVCGASCEGELRQACVSHEDRVACAPYEGAAECKAALLATDGGASACAPATDDALLTARHFVSLFCGE